MTNYTLIDNESTKNHISYFKVSEVGNNMGDIFVHIGISKTGTTFIQKYLRNNQKLLQKHGFFYPFAFCLNDPQHLKLTMAALDINAKHHVREVNDLSDPRKIEELRIILKQTATDEFNENPYENIILSDEGLCALDSIEEISWLRDFIQGIYGKNIKIVAFVRRQDNHAISTYSQEIMSGYCLEGGPFEPRTISPMALWDYNCLLEKYDHVFGRENIKLLVYEDFERSSDGVVSGFLKAIGLNSDNSDEMTVDEGRVNQSLHGEELELVNYINGRLERIGVSVKVRESVASEFRHSLKRASEQGWKGSTVTTCGVNERKKFMTSFNESNELLRQKFLDSREAVFPELNSDFDISRTSTLDVVESNHKLINYVIEAFLLHIEREYYDN